MRKVRDAVTINRLWLVAAAALGCCAGLTLYSCSQPPAASRRPSAGASGATMNAATSTTTTTTTLPAAALPAPPRFDAPPSLRIWLSDLQEEPTVMVRGGCGLQARGSAEVKSLPRLGPAKVTLVSGGFKIGADVFMTTALDIRPDEGASLFVNNKLYSGALRIIRGSNAPALISIVDAESYLLGVLGGEMPSTWPEEALRAQAVAARTYALNMRQERASAEWDLMSTVDDQVYDGGRIAASVRGAVAATRGRVMLHENRLFPAFFHSTCGGRTDKPSVALGRKEYDFLEGVECGYCASSPSFRWQARLSRWEIAKRMTAAGADVESTITSIQVVEPGDGAERAVKVVYDGGERLLPMSEFRKAAGRMVIKSGRFDCVATDDTFEFSGRGLGHGAGMCQYGAKGMAEAGKTWQEILAHYYRNTGIESAY